jgi:hypothetical protein
MEGFSAKLSELNGRLQTLEECRVQYWKEHSECLLFLPEKYRADVCVEVMLDFVINKRADSLKEALNLYEEEQYRFRLEQQAWEKEVRLENKLTDLQWEMYYLRS